MDESFTFKKIEVSLGTMQFTKKQKVRYFQNRSINYVGSQKDKNCDVEALKGVEVKFCIKKYES